MIHFGTRCDLACQHDGIMFGERFASHACVRILREVRIENAVGDEVAHLVGMPSLTDSEVKMNDLLMNNLLE